MCVCPRERGELLSLRGSGNWPLDFLLTLPNFLEENVLNTVCYLLTYCLSLSHTHTHTTLLINSLG